MISKSYKGRFSVSSYLIIRLLVLIAVAGLVLVLIVFILEVALIKLIKVLVLKSLAGEPINGMRDELLLDDLSELVVQFKALLNVSGGIIIVLRGLGGVEEVEERVCGNSLLDHAGLLGVCVGLAKMLYTVISVTPTLVPLLLALNSDSQVLACFPFDLLTLSMVVDVVATVAVLLLIEVRL